MDDLHKSLKDLIKDLSTSELIPDYRTLSDNKAAAVAKLANSSFLDANSVITLVMDYAYHYARELGIGGRDFTEQEKSELTLKILQQINNIPLKYLFTFSMPYSSKGINFAITRNIKIRTLSEDDLGQKEAIEKPKPGTLADFMKFQLNPQTKYTPGQVVLTVKAVGLIDKGAYRKAVISLPDSDPLFTFKAVMSAMSVLGIVDEASKKPDDRYHNNPGPYQVNIHFEKDFEFFTSFSESKEDNIFVGGLGFSDKAVASNLNVLKSLFWNIDTRRVGHTKLRDEQRRLKISLYWYFESIKADRSHNKLIYLTTAIDAILPEVDSKEAKALLVSNILTQSSIRKSEIKDGVIGLYVRRNNIIHGKVPVTVTHNPDDDGDYVAYKGEILLKRLLSQKLKSFSDEVAGLYLEASG